MTELFPLKVSGEEPLTRYLFSSSDFAPTKRSPKSEAFMPQFNSIASRYETSIYRTAALLEAQIWDHGKREVAALRTDGRQLRARVDFKYEEVTTGGLSVEGDPPPMRHAVILGWPSVGDSKEVRKALALEIASRLTGRVRVLP